MSFYFYVCEPGPTRFSILIIIHMYSFTYHPSCVMTSCSISCINTYILATTRTPFLTSVYHTSQPCLVPFLVSVH